MATKKTSVTFQPSPGYVLIEPLDNERKSNLIAVQDFGEKSRKGHVVAIGEARVSDYFEGKITFPWELGDFVVFSVAGCEEARLEYEGDPRHRFILAPFSRVLGKLSEEKGGK